LELRKIKDRFGKVTEIQGRRRSPNAVVAPGAHFPTTGAFFWRIDVNQHKGLRVFLLIVHSRGGPMQTPVQIDFQGIEGQVTARASIEKHVAELEQRFGRVTACRVVLKGPGGHHQTGGLYEVNIRLALPDGREVNVARTPKADERHSDLPFAINDAFKRARRRLQDQVRRMQGQVKQHDGQPIGTVTRLDELGEFGTIEAADGHEVYFHRNSVLDDGFKKITIGTRVIYAEEAGEKGPQASTVKLLGKHGMR
jgi:cold shock CspA family protein